MSSENYIMCGSPLPEDYKPCEHTVKIGRGKSVTSHAGNIRFQSLIEANREAYETAHSRSLKTDVIMQVIRQVKSNSVGNIGFVKKDPSSGRWVALQTISTRTSVGQAFRDLLKGKYKSSKHCKQVMRDREKAEVSRSVVQQIITCQETNGPSSFQCPFPDISPVETNLTRVVSVETELRSPTSFAAAANSQLKVQRQSWVEQLCNLMIPDDSQLELAGNPFEPVPFKEAEASTITLYAQRGQFVPNVVGEDFSF